MSQWFYFLHKNSAWDFCFVLFCRNLWFGHMPNADTLKISSLRMLFFFVFLYRMHECTSTIIPFKKKNAKTAQIIFVQISMEWLLLRLRHSTNSSSAVQFFSHIFASFNFIRVCVCVCLAFFVCSLPETIVLAIIAFHFQCFR